MVLLITLVPCNNDSQAEVHDKIINGDRKMVGFLTNKGNRAQYVTYEI